MKRLIFIALSIILLAQYSCKKTQPNLNNLDCSCAHEVSADFTMEEIVSGSFLEDSIENFWTFTDTTYAEKTVRFTALESGATYKWYMGSEIVNQKQLKRYFSAAFSHQTLPITLVVKKKPNKICFPNDDGYDSITKFLSIKSGIEETVFLEGLFRFYSPELKDSFDVQIDFVPGNNAGIGSRFNLYNYDGKGLNSVNILELYCNWLEAYGPNRIDMSLSPGVRLVYIGENRFKYILYYDQFITKNYVIHYGRKL
ncbi:MAG: hypothetical protein RL264_1581 [Bacteroidota bacterium]|jgi:hypothetical protein